MDLNEILSTTLRRGCGVELDELVRTQDFLDRVADRAAWFEQLSAEDSDLGVAYRAGHLEMGTLLNVLPDELAVQQAEAGTRPDPYLSVLLEVIGEELLGAATKCLPLNVKSSAVLYPASNAEAQIRLINAAYQWLGAAYDTSTELKKKVAPEEEFTDDTVLFQLNIHGTGDKVVITKRFVREIIDYYSLVGRNDDAQKVIDLLEFVLKVRDGGEKGELDNEAANLIIDYSVSHATELAQEDWIRMITEHEYSSEMALPMEYGRLGIAPGVPCCLGMSLMLSAFARLTGLPVMLVNPLDSNIDHEFAINGAYSRSIIEHLAEIEYPNAMYREALQRQVDIASGIEGRVQDFHYSIAMRIVDGRWIQLDPYLNTWGPFSDAWELDRIYSTLTKYKDVLPGLTLVSDDGGETARWEQEWQDRFERSIATAEHILLAVREIPCVIEPDQVDEYWSPLTDYTIYDDSFLWMYQVVNEAADIFELALELHLGQGSEFNEEAYKRAINAGIDEILKLMIGASNPDPGDEIQVVFEGFEHNYNFDPEFRLETIKKMVVRVVDWMVGEWNTGAYKPTMRMLDPTMQFSIPEYNLGLAVTSHVRSWTYPDVPGRLLVGLSSSQILWHEAVDLSKGDDQSDMDHPDVIRAETMVRALPHHHAACEHKLRYIAGLRQEGTRNGQEEGTGSRSRQGDPATLR